MAEIGVSSATTNTPEAILRAQMGYGGWSINPAARGTNAQAMTANRGLFCAIGVPPSSLITNVILSFGTVPSGTNPTSTRVGILDSTGKCVARSNDIGTALKAVTTDAPTAFALTAAYTSAAVESVYYFGLWMEGSYSVGQGQFFTTATGFVKALGNNPAQQFLVDSTGIDLTVGTTYVPLAANTVPWAAWS